MEHEACLALLVLGVFCLFFPFRGGVCSYIYPSWLLYSCVGLLWVDILALACLLAVRDCHLKVRGDKFTGADDVDLKVFHGQVLSCSSVLWWWTLPSL